MHERLLAITSKKAEKILRKSGFNMKRIKGSHQQFYGEIRGQKRRVTVIAKQKRFNP